MKRQVIKAATLRNASHDDLADELSVLYRYAESVGDSDSILDLIEARYDEPIHSVDEAIDALSDSDLSGIVESTKSRLLGTPHTIHLSDDEVDLIDSLLSDFVDAEGDGERYYLAQIAMSNIRSD